MRFSRAEQIDLGISNDQAPRQQARQIAHDLQRGLRTKPAIIGEGISGSSRHWTAGIGPDIGTAPGFDIAISPNSIPGPSEASRTPLGSLTLTIPLQEEQRVGRLAGQ